MSPSELEDVLSLARDVARTTSVMLRGAEDNVGAVRSKGNLRDLVTEWDTRAEDHIRAELAARSPGVPILGEERGAAGDEDAELCWLVDPIDGTVNFAHGLPIFAVALSLEQAGVPVVGVVAAPALGWEFYARAGGGAHMASLAVGPEVAARPLQVSGVDRLEQAMLATGFPYDRATSPENNFARWEHFQRRAGACRRLGAASLDLCFVARGWLDGYWERRLQPWDVSAGALLVVEAGGRVSDFGGGPFRSRDGAAVASNGAIHQYILDELAATAD